MLVAYVIVSAYKITLLVTGKNIYWFALSQAIDYLVISSLLLIVYARLGTQHLSISWEHAKRLFAKSRYYIVFQPYGDDFCSNRSCDVEADGK